MTKGIISLNKDELIEIIRERDLEIIRLQNKLKEINHISKFHKGKGNVNSFKLLK